MENRNPSNSASKPLNNTDVTTWHLPKGAIGRLARGRVQDMSFSADGKYLAVATPIGCWLYDRSSLEPLALFDTECGMLNTIAFSHDTQLIATSNQDGVLKVWDTQTLKCLTKIDHRKNVEATTGYFWNLCFSHDNQYLAASCFEEQNVIYAWQKNTDEPAICFSIDLEGKDKRDLPICFSPIGNLFAYVSAENHRNTLTISDIETGEHITHLSQSSALSKYRHLVFSPCGQYIAATNRNKEVLVWNVYNGTLETEPTTYDRGGISPAYTPDGTLRVAEYYYSKVVIWDVVRKEKIDTFECRKRRHSRFSSDGAYIATILSRSDLCVWTVGSPSTKVSSPADHKPVPHSVAFSNNGKTLASGHAFGMYHVFWNVAQRKTEQIFPTPKMQAQRTALTENLTAEEKQQWYHRLSALSPCWEKLALCDLPKGSIEIWDIASETLITKLSDSKGFGREMRFSPTGEHFIGAASTGDIGVWDTQSGEKVNTLTGHTNFIRTVAFHTEGKQLATVAQDITARLWDIVGGEQIGLFPTELPEDTSLYRGNPEQIHQYIQKYRKIGRRYKCVPHKLAFSPCGTMIACGIQEHIRLRDAATLETHMFILLPETCSRPFALTFSPCGKYLVSGSWWKRGLDRVSIRIWEVATGKNIHTFWGHTTDVQDLAFSPDGKFLASASYDGTILLWDTKPFINS